MTTRFTELLLFFLFISFCTGGDNTFKVWNVETKTKEEKKMSWLCFLNGGSEVCETTLIYIIYNKLKKKPKILMGDLLFFLKRELNKTKQKLCQLDSQRRSAAARSLL